MGDATEAYFLRVFGETLDIARTNDVSHLVIGSIAHIAHLAEPWDPGSDIDLLVTKADAERCLEIYPEHGFSAHIRDPGWIYKVAKPNVVIDLIFLASGRVELDDEMLERAVERRFEDLTLPLPSVEDMVLLFALLDIPTRREGHWYDAMTHLARVNDWDYLVARAERYGPEKLLAVFLYGRETGISVPDAAIRRLASYLDTS